MLFIEVPTPGSLKPTGDTSIAVPLKNPPLRGFIPLYYEKNIGEGLPFQIDTFSMNEKIEPATTG